MTRTLAEAAADIRHAARNQDVQWLRSRLGIDEKQARHLLQEIKLKRLLAPHHERMAQIKAAREKAAGRAVAPEAAADRT